MSGLGEALDLLLRASSRYSTVRAVIHTVFTPLPDQVDNAHGDEPVTREEEVLRVWLAPPDRMRVESEGVAGGWRLGIRDGPLWWAIDDDGSRHSNVHEPDVGTDIGDSTKLLFDPAPLAGALKLEVMGQTEVRGRPAIRLRGTRRPHVVTTVFELEELQPDDELEIDVDAERGVLLRRRGRVSGHEWLLQEIVDIGFDEEFEAEKFVLAPADP